MLDVKLLRERPEDIQNQLAKRRFTLDLNTWQQIESKRKTLQVEVEALQNLRNQYAKKIGEAKRAGQDAENLLKEAEIGQKDLDAKQKELDTLLGEQQYFLSTIPNLPHTSVPAGTDETQNQLIYEWGAKPNFQHTPLDHLQIGKNLIAQETAAKLSGSRFMLLEGEMASLHRALTQFMLDTHTEMHGYIECYVPYIVNADCLFGTGQLPKFEEDLFKIHERAAYLIPTAEVPLTNTVKDSLLNLDTLPIRLTGHTPCFRSEAGSASKDTRGIFRQHQFDKIELVQIVHPQKSYEALEELCNHAETILQKLKLPYRKMLLCTGDMGFCAAKTYDLEVWLPGQNQYREISSCSNCEDFQARRMMARVRVDGKKIEYVHTLNGSGLAVGRCLIAVLENYQQPDGTVKVPEVLVPYLKGKTVLFT